MKILWFFIALLLLLTPGCEKDDICDEYARTTPRLIVSFYDFSNANNLKNVNALEVYGDGANDVLGVYSSVNQIALPLRTTNDFTQYRFKLNSNNATASNTDYLQINYTRADVYVSRACGFKTIFQLATPNGLVLTDEQPADGTWIKNITISTPDISNEDETHVNIYF
jgi:hypothetical protein